MFPLPKMRRIAETLCAALAPHCEKLEIAGSIRRECPLPGDIDLVCLPRPGAAPALRAAFLALAEGPFGKVETDGPDAKRILGGRSGIQCDLWIARQPETGLFDSRPGNFGTLLLTYTGSMGHNINRILPAAYDIGAKWNPNRGLTLKDGTLISEDERHILDALRLGWVEPRDRNADRPRAPRSEWVESMLDRPPFSNCEDLEPLKAAF